MLLGREGEREGDRDPGEAMTDLAEVWLIHDRVPVPEEMFMLSKLNDVFIGLEHITRASDLLSIYQSTDLRFIIRESDS